MWRELAALGGYQAKYAISAYLEVPNAHGALEPQSWGVAVLTRAPIGSQTVTSYADEPGIRLLRDPNDPRRVLIMTELIDESGIVRIGTTHFTWSVGGDISDAQRADFARLKRVLADFPDYVLCGDFNAPRGQRDVRNLSGGACGEGLLTAHIRSTLDPLLHRVGHLELAVDTIFATRGYAAHGGESARWRQRSQGDPGAHRARDELARHSGANASSTLPGVPPRIA